MPAHEGIDFKAPHGTIVRACADGTISRVERTEFQNRSGWPYGIQIRITHVGPDGQIYETIYAHLQEADASINTGDNVKRGQQIGLSDNTGNSRGDHLHLSLKKRGATDRRETQELGDGRLVTYPSDLVNPQPYFKGL